MKTTRDRLLDAHGPGDCHICGKPKAERGEELSVCSYPHGRIPVHAVDPEHPEGFWSWGVPE